MVVEGIAFGKNYNQEIEFTNTYKIQIYCVNNLKFYKIYCKNYNSKSKAVYNMDFRSRYLFLCYFI